MITIRPNSRVYEFLTFLSYAGEFPYASIHLLGSREAWRKLIFRLSQQQEYRIPGHPSKINGRLLNISGSGKTKTIRMSQCAIEILEEVNPTAASYYRKIYSRHNRSGAADRVERNHRVAESAAFFRLAGVETNPCTLPALQLIQFGQTVPEETSFYSSHEIKHVGSEEVSKLGFSRITGMLFSKGGCYAVYNSRDYLMHWNGRGESKVKLHLSSVARMNHDGTDGVNSAIMLASGYEVGAMTLSTLKKVKRPEMRFDAIYDHLHLIPLNEFGCKLTKILTLPDWKQMLLELLFDEDDIGGTGATFGYDAVENGVYIFSFLDSDLFRLNRFHSSVKILKCDAMVICFPEQYQFLKAFLDKRIKLKTVSMDAVLQSLPIEGSNAYE